MTIHISTKIHPVAARGCQDVDQRRQVSIRRQAQTRTSRGRHERPALVDDELLHETRADVTTQEKTSARARRTESGRRRRRRYFTRRRPSRDRRDRSRVRHHPTANDIRVRASEPTENDQFPHQPLFAEQKVSLTTAFAQSFAPPSPHILGRR